MMAVERSRGPGTDFCGGVGSPGPHDTGGVRAVDETARALLQRMVLIPGAPESTQAQAEAQAIRFVLYWTAEPTPSGRPGRVERRVHQLAMLRRYHRTVAHLGLKNRYSVAVLWGYRATGWL